MVIFFTLRTPVDTIAALTKLPIRVEFDGSA